MIARMRSFELPWQADLSEMPDRRGVNTMTTLHALRTTNLGDTTLNVQNYGGPYTRYCQQVVTVTGQDYTIHIHYHRANPECNRYPDYEQTMTW
jgi:hypothetical protein